MKRNHPLTKERKIHNRALKKLGYHEIGKHFVFPEGEPREFYPFQNPTKNLLFLLDIIDGIGNVIGFSDTEHKRNRERMGFVMDHLNHVNFPKFKGDIEKIADYFENNPQLFTDTRRYPNE